MYDGVLKYSLICKLHTILSVTVVITVSSLKLPCRKMWMLTVDVCLSKIPFVTVRVRTMINSNIYILCETYKFTNILQLLKCNIFNYVIAKYMCTCTHMCLCVCVYIYIYTHIYIHRVSQEEGTKLRGSVP